MIVFFFFKYYTINVLNRQVSIKEEEMSKIVKTNEKIEKAVVSGYKKIETGAVNTYKKIEDKFVDTFLRKDDETIDEAKERVLREQRELQDRENNRTNRMGGGR